MKLAIDAWVVGAALLGALAWRAYGDRMRETWVRATTPKPRTKEELQKSSGPFTLTELEVLGKAPLLKEGDDDKLLLVPGQRYRMVYAKSRVEPLASKGFSKVWRTDLVSQLPDTWQTSTVQDTHWQSASGGPAEPLSFASAIWTGPDTSLERPDGLVSIWPTTQEI